VKKKTAEDATKKMIAREKGGQGRGSKTLLPVSGGWLEGTGKLRNHMKKEGRKTASNFSCGRERNTVE